MCLSDPPPPPPLTVSACDRAFYIYTDKRIIRSQQCTFAYSEDASTSLSENAQILLSLLFMNATVLPVSCSFLLRSLSASSFFFIVFTSSRFSLSQLLLFTFYILSQLSTSTHAPFTFAAFFFFFFRLIFCL